jgi:hypothetical protein
VIFKFTQSWVKIEISLKLLTTINKKGIMNKNMLNTLESVIRVENKMMNCSLKIMAR